MPFRLSIRPEVKAQKPRFPWPGYRALLVYFTSVRLQGTFTQELSNMPGRQKDTAARFNLAAAINYSSCIAQNCTVAVAGLAIPPMNT